MVVLQRTTETIQSTELPRSSELSPETPRIRIRVRHAAGTNETTITGITPIPTIRNLLQVLPTDISRRIRRSSRIPNPTTWQAGYLVTIGILTCQELADYLAIYQNRLTQNEGISEIPSGPMYLASGQTLYRLAPVAQIEASRGLAAIRARLNSQTAIERRNLIRIAEEEAAELRQAANQMYQEAADRERDTRNLRPMPLGLWNRLVMFTPDNVFVETFGRFAIREFHFGSSAWKAMEARPFSYPLRIAFTGDLTAIDWGSFQSPGKALPHICPDSACITPGETIPITPGHFSYSGDVGDLLSRIIRVVNRAFSVVNLSSPLTSARHWPDEVKRFCPESFANYLQTGEVESLPPAEFTLQEPTWSL